MRHAEGGVVDGELDIFLDCPGSSMRSTYCRACCRRGLYSISVGVNTIVSSLACVIHLVAGYAKLSACNRACDGCESCSKLVDFWFWYLRSTMMRCMCVVMMAAVLKRL